MKSLTKEQVQVAFSIIRKGGPEGEQAMNQFVYLNQRLVSFVAKNYRDKGLLWEELLSAGKVGLLQAVNRFDPSKGTKFSTFAVPWIEGEIKQLFASTKKQKQSIARIRQTAEGVPLVFDDLSESEAEEDAEFEQQVTADLQKQDEPASEKLSDYADLQEAVVQDAESDGGLGMNATQARAEGIGSGAGCAEFSSTVRGEDTFDDPEAGSGAGIEFVADWSLCSLSDDFYLGAVEDALERLENPRHKEVIAMHFGLLGQKRHTFAEIGRELGVTAQRAEAIQRDALKLLREDPELTEL